MKEVLCNDAITKEIVTQVQNALREKGYFQEEDSFLFDTKTKASLTKFQKDNNLPVGQLDFETLEVLGINI